MRLATIAGSVGSDGEKVRFQLLFFTQFVAGSGFIVFRNVYLEEMGLSGSAMGVVGFLVLATGVAVQPLWGTVTDYWGIERAVLIVAAAISALALSVYPIAADLAEPFLIVAIGTGVFSAFRAPIVPVATGMVLSRGYDFGHVRGVGSLAFAVGSLGFGFLVARTDPSAIVYGYVLGMVVLVAIAWSLSGASLSAATDDTDDTGDIDGTTGDGGSVEDSGDAGDPEGIETGEREPQLSLSRAVWTLVTDRTFLVVLAAVFLLRLSFMGGEAFLAVYMRAVNATVVVGPWSLAPDSLTGIAWAMNSGIEAVAFVTAVRLGFSYKRLLVAGGTIVVVPNLVYGVTTQPWAILAVQAFGGVGFAFLTLAAVNLVHAVATEAVQSSAQTLLDGVGLGLGGAVGQLVAGTLFEAVGIQRMYVYIAAIGFVGATVGVLVSHQGRLDDGDTAV